MRAVVQRVTNSDVKVEGQVLGAIDTGLMVLLGVGPDDGEKEIEWLAKKIVKLRIFPDDEGRMNKSLIDAGGSCLIISQFTLMGDCRKGNRPSFIHAAKPEIAEPLYERFIEAVAAHGVPVQSGKFGGYMMVSLINDGPVTLIIDTP